MGHEVLYYEFDENESKGKISAIANEDAEYNSDMRTGLESNIRFLDDKIYEDEDEAHEAIKRLDKGWYDQLAVKFNSYGDVKATKAMINLEDRIERITESIIEYRSKSSIKNRKSQYVGCTNCGSKINKDYVSDLEYDWNQCPLCREDLSSETVKNTIINRRDKISELMADLESKRKLNSKKGKITVSWLVKTEYHV